MIDVVTGAVLVQTSCCTVNGFKTTIVCVCLYYDILAGSVEACGK